MKLREYVYEILLAVIGACMFLIIFSANDEVDFRFMFIMTGIMLGASLLACIVNNPYVFGRHIVAIISTILVTFNLTKFGKDVKQYKIATRRSMIGMYKKYLKAYDDITDDAAFWGSISDKLMEVDD